jgi:hypothetical protein
MAERRKGGETGVKAVEVLRGDPVWKLLATSGWGKGGLDPQLLEACLSRSHTLSQPATFSHRYPTPAQMKEMVKSPVAYRIEYADGLKGTMLLLNGLTQDFLFAARVRGEKEPLSTLFHLPPNPNVTYSAALMSRPRRCSRRGRRRTRSSARS